ncbi:MAG: single-stranded DNA-binding protein [Candidatus Cloacimonadota bacterium]|nr:MAG: single-stranded DNA-binding protein [Candidatus Cloacimonadota bacterium]
MTAMKMKSRERNMSEIRLPSINKVMISGRLTADPNLNFTPDGVPVLKFRLASSRSYKDRDGNWQKAAAFVSVSVWREQAERFAETLHKGSAVFIEGRLESRSWEVEGQRRNIVEINAWRIQNLEKAAFGPKAETEEKNADISKGDTETDQQDDDLPF